MRPIEKEDVVRVFQCQCRAPEHMMALNYDAPMMGPVSWWEPEMMLTFYISSYLPWYKRLWAALKFVFGVYGNDPPFDCALIKPIDVPAIVKVLNDFKEDHEQYWAAFMAKLDAEKKNG